MAAPILPPIPFDLVQGDSKASVAFITWLNDLRATVVSITGGGGTPAGSTTEVQYNDAGAFGADSRFVFDATNKVVVSQFGFDANCINAQTGTTYTLVASDNGKLITLSNAAAITLTVPSGLGAGYNCMIAQIGAGQVTVATSGTTLTSYGTLTKLAGQYACATLIANVANTFLLSGTLA